MVRWAERALTWWLVGVVEVAAWALHAWTPQDDPEDCPLPTHTLRSTDARIPY